MQFEGRSPGKQAAERPRTERSNSPAPRTFLLLECVFQAEAPATAWLDRPNPRLGGVPRVLIRDGREKEVQAYLVDWILPAKELPRQECPLTRLDEAVSR
jgi:hypothetical protein